MDGKGCNVIVDTVVYALLNKKIRGLMSGIQSVTVDGTTLKFVFNDGSTQNMVFPNPKSGASITDVNIKEISNEYHLICTITDADGNETEIDAGIIPNAKVQIASKTTAGIVKVGDNLEITSDGTLSAIGGGKPYEISKADYDALTEEERKDKVFYVYDDDEGYDGGEGGSGGDTYTGTSAVDLGGIKNNQVFDKTPLPDVIDMLLHPYEKPTMTLGIKPVKTIYDTVSETLSSITINANVTKKSENIKEVRFYVNNVLVKTDTTHPTGGLVSYTHTFSPATNKTFNVKIECEDIKGTSSKISANTNVYFVGQSYYGVIEDDGSDFTITETLIKGLSETSLKIKKALTYENINATFGRIVYAYPKNLPTGGELTSIKDQGTGWSVFDSYAKQEVTVDGIVYLCYYLIDPAGFDGVTMIFA